MLAVVPTQWRSSGPGSSISLLRCSSTPSGRCCRAASCAAARERSRPIVIGSTTPGNNTTFRPGNMTSASSGNGREVRSAFVCAEDALGGTTCAASSTLTGILSASPFINLSLFFSSIGLTHDQPQAPFYRFTADGLQPLLRQRNAPLEITMRNLQPPDRAIMILHRQAPFGGDHETARLHGHFDPLWRHAGQRHENGDLLFVLEYVDRRLPASRLSGRRSQREELPVHPFGLFQELAGFRPHPSGWVT